MAKSITILTAGVLTVFGSFLILAFMDMVWFGFFLSTGLGIGFMWLIFNINKKELSDNSSKKMIATFFTILTVGSVSIFSFGYVRAEFQKDTLRNIRLQINESIIHVQVKAQLFDVYRSYELSDDPNTSIVELALDKFEDKIISDNSITGFFEGSEKEFDFRYAADLEKDEFTVYTVSKTINGDDLEFENKNNDAGRHQARVTVSKNGVSYDREN